MTTDNLSPDEHLAKFRSALLSAVVMDAFGEINVEEIEEALRHAQALDLLLTDGGELPAAWDSPSRRSP